MFVVLFGRMVEYDEGTADAFIGFGTVGEDCQNVVRFGRCQGSTRVDEVQNTGGRVSDELKGLLQGNKSVVQCEVTQHLCFLDPTDHFHSVGEW